MNFITTDVRRKSLREAMGKNGNVCLLSCESVPPHISINTL